MISISSLFSKFIKKLEVPFINKCCIDKTAKIYAGSSVVYSKIGKYTYCSYDCKLLHVNIGNFCSIAEGVVIGGASHPMDWVTTSPVFIEGHNPLGKNLAQNHYEAFKTTTIGNDVWIGERAIIKAGIKIGDGAVIGMGSVVTHDVEPYSIVAGNPAKEIRKRFDEETIKLLLKSEWWNMNDKQLREKSKYFTNIGEWVGR